MFKSFLAKFKKDWMIYLAIFVAGFLLYAFVPGAMELPLTDTLKSTATVIFKLALRGGILYAFARFDFKEINFAEEIKKNNLSVGIAFLALAIIASSI